MGQVNVKMDNANAKVFKNFCIIFEWLYLVIKPCSFKNNFFIIIKN